MRAAIVGTGYVGLVTGVCLASLGHHVTCVDIQAPRLESIRRGKVPFQEPGLAELLGQVLDDGRLQLTVNLETGAADSQVILIAVGTPSVEKEIDLSQVRAAAESAGHLLRDALQYRVVAVKSTVVPGTTDTL